jgi:ComF family protein
MLQMLFETRCAGCGAAGAPLCRTCRFALVARHPSARAVAGPAGHEVFAAAPFTGRVRSVLLGFKYANRRAVAGHLAGLLVNRLVTAGVAGGVDVVTWAPTSARRRRERGFDQAELVARQVARQLGRPCRRLLEREPGAEPQTGRDRAGRMHGPVFRARPLAPAGTVLLVDDVVTTGATLRAASAALRRAGAQSVVQAAIAATPAVVSATEPGREVSQGPSAA